VQELRTAGSTWRHVAFTCSERWGLPYGPNQLWGQDLCREAAKVLGHDVGFDLCVSSSPLDPEDYVMGCLQCLEDVTDPPDSDYVGRGKWADDQLADECAAEEAARIEKRLNAWKKRTGWKPNPPGPQTTTTVERPEWVSQIRWDVV
jgi:hypothetical protein